MKHYFKTKWKKNQTIKEIQNLSHQLAGNINDLLRFKFMIPESLETLKRSKESLMMFSQLPGIEKPDQRVIDHWNSDIDFLASIPDTFYPMTIVYTITLFEVFLADVTRILTIHFWQSFKSKGKMMSYEEILGFEDLKTLKEHMTENEIMKFSYDSIKGRINFLEKKFNLKFSYVRQKGVHNN